MLLSVVPGSPPDDPVLGLGPCSPQPRLLQSGASFCRILSVASDAPVRGTGFTPGRSSPRASAVLHSPPGCSHPGHLYIVFSLLPRMLQSVAPGSPPDDPVQGACAVLHSAPDAPIRRVFSSYSLRCLGCSSAWHRVHPRMIQSRGSGRAPLRPGVETCFSRFWGILSSVLEPPSPKNRIFCTKTNMYGLSYTKAAIRN